MPLCYFILSKVGPCSLPSCFMLFSWAPSSPQCCLYSLLEGQLENHWSLGGFHTSAYWGICQSGSPRSSTCLGISYLKTCHSSTCSGIRQSRSPRRSTCLDLPRDPILRRPKCLNLPGIKISKRLSCLSLPGICSLTWRHLALRLQPFWVW